MHEFYFDMKIPCVFPLLLILATNATTEPITPNNNAGAAVGAVLVIILLLLAAAVVCAVVIIIRSRRRRTCEIDTNQENAFNLGLNNAAYGEGRALLYSAIIIILVNSLCYPT